MPTHVIIHHREQDGAVLYRASDGMVLAARQGTIVSFGVDPGKTEQRHFMDKSFASGYLRTLAADDLLASAMAECTCGDNHTGACLAKLQQFASIEDREGDKRIISPADAIGAGLRN